MRRHTKLPSLKSLMAFEAVSRHLQMNLAADELAVTPSAVSHLIKKLENELGLSLIRKSGRTIALTDSGSVFAHYIQHGFGTMRKAVHEVREMHNPDIVTVSLRPYFAMKWLSPRLYRFWNSYPDIELRLIHTNKDTDFKLGNVNLAIEWTNIKRQDTRNTLLVPGELTPVFSPKLKGADAIRTAGDLFNFTLLSETDHNSWKDWFNAAGIDYKKPKNTVYIDDSNVRYQAAIDRQGIELGCRSLIADDLLANRLIAPFDQSVNQFSYYLLEPLTAHPNSAVEKFSQWLIDEVKRTAA